MGGARECCFLQDVLVRLSLVRGGVAHRGPAEALVAHFLRCYELRMPGRSSSLEAMKEFSTQQTVGRILPTRIVLQRPRHRMKWQARGLWSQSCRQLPRRSFATMDCGIIVLFPFCTAP